MTSKLTHQQDKSFVNRKSANSDRIGNRLKSNTLFVRLHLREGRKKQRHKYDMRTDGKNIKLGDRYKYNKIIQVATSMHYATCDILVAQFLW